MVAIFGACNIGGIAKAAIGFSNINPIYFLQCQAQSMVFINPAVRITKKFVKDKSLVSNIVI